MKTAINKLIAPVAFIAAMALAATPAVSHATESEEVVAEAAASLVEWKPDTNNGSVQLPLSKQREAILRFDVNGMANATNVMARFYCSAHLASAATPVVLRVMRDVDWNPSSVTPNNMKHEIPFFPSTWIGRGDPLFAGSFNVSATNAYYEADVTAAAREAARTTGKLALHVYSAWWHEDSAWSVLEGPGTSVEEQRPRLVAQWADSARSPTIPGQTETIELEPTDDMYVNLKSSNAVANTGSLYARAWGYEAFLKFATSAFAGRVVSATLKLSLSSTVDASNPWEVTLLNGGNWSETEATLPSGLSVINNWGSVPVDSVRITTGLAAENTVDVTSLVTKGQNFASGFLTFRLNAKEWGPPIATFYSKDAADATKHPKLILVVRKGVSASRVNDAVTVSWQAVSGASSYRVARAEDPDGPFETVATVTGTSAVDPTCPGKATYWYRVFSVAGGVETTVDTVRFSENTTTASRSALYDCGVNSASQSTPVYNQASYQIGCQQWDGVTRAMYICFDPNGLEEAPYVRLRVKTVWANGLSGQNKPARLFGAVTDRFDPTNVCWSSAVFGLPVHAPIASGSTYDEDMGRIVFDVTTGDFSPFLEFDVTDVVREAARQGRYASFQLSLEAANANYARWIAGVASGTPPVLLYPPVEGFNRLAAEDDLSGENPKVNLTWGAGPAGTTYTVERTVENEAHDILVSGISETEYLDRMPFADETVYKVTANLPNGQTSVQELTHTVDAAIKIRASADTYVFGAESGRDSTFGTARSLQIKYDSWGTVNREGVLRFDLRAVPDNFKKAYLRLRIIHSNAPNAYDKVCFRTVPDFAWTDAAAPSWRDLLGDQVGSSLPSASGVFATFYPGTVPLWADGAEVSVDMTATVRAAKAAGQQAVTVHFYPLDGVSDMIQFYSRESGMSGYAPYISVEPRNWHPKGFTLIMR